jgi:hypothetical protein
MMKKFASIFIFSILLASVCFSQTNVSLKPANRELLLKLLDFPSPPENRFEQIADWLKRENENLSGKTNIIPADDAPVEEIVKFWAGKRIYDVPKPTEKTREILLSAVEKDWSLVAGLLHFLPTDARAVEIITRAIAEADKVSQISNGYDIKQWLLMNNPAQREELISIVEKIQGKPNDREDFGAVEWDEHLIALSKLDWERAYPVINACLGSKNPRLSTLALTLLYKNAVRENSADAEDFRERLKQIAVDKNAKGYARNIAVESLMQTDWQERDEWFISLFSDESLSNGSDNGFGYETLPSVVEDNPDYWIPKIAKLLGNSNKTVHFAAAISLSKFEKYRAREDAMRALLPYLEDTGDWTYYGDGGAIYSLNFIYLPESIPVLKRIVEKEDDYNREYAAEALGVKYKVADAAPILEKALMSEPRTNYQEGIIQGLVHCGGLSDEKKIAAIEFYLQNEPPKESSFTEERHPLIGLGIYLGNFASTDEAFTKTLLSYAAEIEKDKPAIAAKIKSLAYSWDNREANLALIKAIEEDKAAAADILNAIQKREALKKDFYAQIQTWTEKPDKKAGIAAVILEDETEIAKIINGNNREAQAFLFASARLTEKFTGGSFLIQGTGIEVQVNLPLENVKRLFARKDKDLSAAIEKYLEAEDGETARKLILSEHKGEAKIVGRRLPKQFGGDFEELDKWEENLRREILKDKNLEEIYAAPNGVVRIRNGKAEVTVIDYNWETEKSSERKYFLSEDKLRKLKNGFAKTNPFALKPISTPSNSCFMQPASNEFLYLTKNGGVRVYIATLYSSFEGDEYANLLNLWNSL